MRRLTLAVLLMPLIVLLATPVESQSIVADDSVETAAQLVSKVATGTAPIAVSSMTLVPNLNADQVDGLDASAFALDEDLQNVEALLLALGTSRVPRTGQSIVYATGDDGQSQLGVTWPNPRFTDAADGTVMDNLTSLIWLTDAHCSGQSETWTDALAIASALFDGCTDCGGTDDDCGLSDGSLMGEWRLPNVRELQSLAHYGVSAPAVPNTAGTGQWTAGDPFLNVQFTLYWSSSTYDLTTTRAWYVDMNSGLVFHQVKTDVKNVWLVRGGQ